ncbi:GSCOCT00014166001.2-RA-CDS [Cotesia congregata]|uniref:Cc_odve66_31 n=1 Tax=Cotesia congregata TaxID=51543 RepID=A0A8J2MIH5_COTCN|nr:GSCOCT00014166001.2-RA-CDS [Cotesia congregata]CAG5083105.1 Cc_odve66_31 [Cotesia congregata]
MQITDLCDVGCHYLKDYVNEPNKPKYLKWGNDIVKLVLDEKLKGFNLKNYSDNFDDLVCSIGLFCIMFEYVADKSEYDDTKQLCDEFILKLVPKLKNRGKYSTYFQQFDFYTNTLRMMTNYLYRKELFNQESNDPEMIEFNKQIKDVSSTMKQGEVKFRYEIYLPLIKI